MCGESDIEMNSHSETKECEVHEENPGVYEKPLDLDDVLVNELGQLGRFQLRIILLITVPIMMAAFMSEFIFSAAAIPHRCWIPECNENSKTEKYHPTWILNAVPRTSSGFSSCQRFALSNVDTNGTLDNCPAKLFDQSKTVECEGFVYEKNNSVVFDFDLGCQDWLRAFAGTLNSIGILLAMPITGYLSDRFGRRFALVINVFNLSLIGLIRAFSVNYTMYLILQIVQTTLGAGTFSSAYIFGTFEKTGGRPMKSGQWYHSKRTNVQLKSGPGLLSVVFISYLLVGRSKLRFPMRNRESNIFGPHCLSVLWTPPIAILASLSVGLSAELVGPKYRVLTSATLSSIFAIGQVILGAVAWLIQPWRYMIMALHIPGFVIIAYYGILSESVRWLIAKQKFAEAKKVLEAVARVNGTQISEKSLQALMKSSELPLSKSKAGRPSLIVSILRSPTLLRRVCTTPIWWITTIFVYYGLSIDSTSLSDTIYLNYILTCAIEIPGFYTAVFLLDRFGRKATISSGFFFSSACNIIFVFIPNNLSIFRLIIFLLGKFGISMVMTSLYLFTSELYPTEFRHSLLAFSSMIGRIGSITAPLTPVLMKYWHGIPSMMFGGMGILSGLLVLTQPETLGTKMPDTLAEAEALGKPESKLKGNS